MSLPAALQSIRDEIEAYARGYGLDFLPTIFEVIDWRQMHEVAAYGGFPTRYPHWRFGMAFERLEKAYAYGLQKIYELVINNDPCYAYLLHCNNEVDQKLVMAHVFAHADFFKNNAYFSKTNRKMVDEMANHSVRIRKYMERFGVEEVEGFIDACLSLENLIDPHSLGIVRRSAGEEEEGNGNGRGPRRLRSKGYMEEFINPPDILEAEEKELQESKESAVDFPRSPERDVLWFLVQHAPLPGWKRDILSIIREEAYYFVPQAQTKIMNEGWASYWHSTIMTEKALRDSELIDYADHCSGTLAAHTGQLNPYKLGLELFRDIEDRWNRGRFGRQYEECDRLEDRESWDVGLGLGRRKIFEVRSIYNDVSFIEEFFTPDFCRENLLFTFGYSPERKRYEIEQREFETVKGMLLQNLTNMGQPRVRVLEGNHGNRGELYLEHQHDGVDLKLDWAKATLRHLQSIWGRPVHLETVFGGKRTVFGFDGSEETEKKIEE
jgi:stage V sporulation protein R